MDCGFPGVKEETCLYAGCCWDTTVNGVPWCFYPTQTTMAVTTEKPTTTQVPGPNCDVGNPKHRVDCGFPGIKEETCLYAGCCWDTTVSGVPWCFHGVDTTVPPTTTMPPTTTQEPDPNCDVGPPSERVDCGYPGITPNACRDRNCCWDESIRDVPWCFFGKMTTPEPAPNCDVGPASERVDCGYPGIHPDTCRERNCCWDNSIRDVPWCFFGKLTTQEPAPNCDVGPASERVDCGYPGIHPDTCRERKCCWDESIRDVPWCFFGVTATTATTTAITVTQAPIAHCDVPLKSRKRCGQDDVTREQCIKKKCCWQLSKIYGVPSCYYAAERPSPSGCDPQLPHRLTCGYLGIKEKECSAKGCCWDDSVPGRPKCYRPNTGQSLFTTSTKSSQVKSSSL